MSIARTNENDVNEDRTMESRADADLTAEPRLPAQRTSAQAAPGRVIKREKAPTPDHRLRWPESLAITVALLLGGAVASGLFHPMLPWLG